MDRNLPCFIKEFGDRKVIKALEEFHRWCRGCQVVATEVDWSCGELVASFYYDIAEDLERCVDKCTGEDYSNIDAVHACHESCEERISGNVEAIFKDIVATMESTLKLYGFKYKVDEGWNHWTRYATFILEL